MFNPNRPRGSGFGENATIDAEDASANAENAAQNTENSAAEATQSREEQDFPSFASAPRHPGDAEAPLDQPETQNAGEAAVEILDAIDLSDDVGQYAFMDTLLEFGVAAAEDDLAAAESAADDEAAKSSEEKLAEIRRKQTLLRNVDLSRGSFNDELNRLWQQKQSLANNDTVSPEVANRAYTDATLILDMQAVLKGEIARRTPEPQETPEPPETPGSQETFKIPTPPNSEKEPQKSDNLPTSEPDLTPAEVADLEAPLEPGSETQETQETQGAIEELGQQEQQEQEPTSKTLNFADKLDALDDELAKREQALPVLREKAAEHRELANDVLDAEVKLAERRRDRAFMQQMESALIQSGAYAEDGTVSEESVRDYISSFLVVQQRLLSHYTKQRDEYPRRSAEYRKLQRDKVAPCHRKLAAATRVASSEFGFVQSRED